MANVTGWNEMMNGSLVQGAYSMYNGALAGNFLTVMFCVLTATLYMKTKNPTLCFIVGLIFYAMFYNYFTASGLGIMIIILIFELGVVLYDLLIKE